MTMRYLGITDAEVNWIPLSEIYYCGWTIVAEKLSSIRIFRAVLPKNRNFAQNKRPSVQILHLPSDINKVKLDPPIRGWA